MFTVPISVLSEITGTAEKKLRTAYWNKLTGADNDLLPVDILPHDQIELYLNKYLFHDRYLDIDLFRLASKDLPNTISTFPLLAGPHIQAFFKETEMVRRANREVLSCSGNETVTQRLSVLASEYSVSYRTLMRKRRLFMNQSNLNMLLSADHNAYLYHDHLTSMCLYACDYAIYRHLAVNSPSANKILREL